MYSTYINQLRSSFERGFRRNCWNLTYDLGPNMPQLHLLSALQICEGEDGSWIQQVKVHITDCG